MTHTLRTRPLTPQEFTHYGDILDASGTPDKIINRGLCGRFHDRARLDFGDGGRAGISVFKGEICSFPIPVELVERHPEGSQAFIPLSQNPFLVVVAPDNDGTPGAPMAFLTAPGQAINFHRGIWHGVFSPLAEPGLFAVVDRIGNTPNLEEYWYKTPYVVKD
ncbi:MAG: ureidoglycolate lyase [Paracoccaceae bacterium]